MKNHLSWDEMYQVFNCIGMVRIEVMLISKI